MAVVRPPNAVAVKPLQSNTVGNVPIAAEMSPQEIAINTVDRKLFVKNLSDDVDALDFVEYFIQRGTSAERASNTNPNVLVWSETDTGLWWFIKSGAWTLDTGDGSGVGTVINNTLFSTSTTEALAAAQGKALKDLIDGLGTIHKVDDIAGRDAAALAGTIDSLDVAHVLDDGDGNWARYQNTGTAAAPVWVKVSDEDVVAAGFGATNLSTTYTPTSFTIANTAGNNALVLLANDVSSGAMIPSGGVAGKLVFTTATGYEIGDPSILNLGPYTYVSDTDPVDDTTNNVMNEETWLNTNLLISLTRIQGQWVEI